ncbi:unnamed protein product [Linum tenue]|uniref:Uncharacterized protein n=1 Tax=Linum tenue TaxID=586396 RepID=A0AAV0K674_9ROSI|nr:unnamed protein product [Linum tenue]
MQAAGPLLPRPPLPRRRRALQRHLRHGRQRHQAREQYQLREADRVRRPDDERRPPPVDAGGACAGVLLLRHEERVQRVVRVHAGVQLDGAPGDHQRHGRRHHQFADQGPQRGRRHGGFLHGAWDRHLPHRCSSRRLLLPFGDGH